MSKEERIKLHEEEIKLIPQRCPRKAGKGQYALTCKKCNETYKA